MAILSISFKKNTSSSWQFFFAFSNHKNRNNSVVAGYLSQLVKRTFLAAPKVLPFGKAKEKGVFLLLFAHLFVPLQKILKEQYYIYE